MSNQNNAAATNDASNDESATKGMKRYNYRGFITRLKSGTCKDGKAWASYTLVGKDGKKKVECFAYDAKATQVIDMASQAGDTKEVNAFGFFNPARQRTFKNAEGKEIKVRQLQTLAMNWPLPPKAKASAEAPKEEVAAEMVNSAADEENPF